MANLLYANQYITTTLSVAGGIDDSQTTDIVLASTASIETGKPGMALLSYADPLDTSSAEWVEYTSINTSTKALVGVTRGSEGYSAKAHSNGAAIAFPLTESHINRINDKLTSNDTTLASDPHGNEIVKTAHNDSAVNEITVTNAATGNAPVISATGGDDKIPLGLAGKAAFVKATGLYDCGTVGATETVSWKNGDRQKLTLDENLTITFGDAVAGQTLTLYLYQDGSGTNTITFADTITWADATTPTWTTTASKLNIAVIYYDGSAYYGVGNKFA